jgi:hypothetical protein
MSARAQVGSEHDTGGAWGRAAVNPGGHGSPVHATLQMWVAPEAEQPPQLRTVTLENGMTLFESHLSLWGGEIERMGAGRWTHVHYRADQPQRCEIDKDRLTRPPPCPPRPRSRRPQPPPMRSRLPRHLPRVWSQNSPSSRNCETPEA